MNKHTPGPWKVSDERECQEEHFASVLCDAPGRRGAEIAILNAGFPLVGAESYRDGEGMANAALIAASPSLLAACEATHRYFLACVAQHVADPERTAEGTTHGPGLDVLGEVAAEKTMLALDQVHGRLKLTVEGMEEVDLQKMLREVNAELLAACKAALKAYDDAYTRKAGRSSWKGEDVDRMRAAIAKAENT
jgi:hypothetical protein